MITPTNLTYLLVSILLLLFLLIAARDLFLLFRRPARGLGTGLSRVHAVAHTTMIEAWTSRIWLLPLLWFIVAIILCLAVRPYDESERIPLYIRMLLLSQEILLLVMIAIMACVSLPRERERKIIITNASKPLSRLEILLGKMLGFSLTSLIMVVIMGAMSFGILFAADQWMRSNALKQYTLAETDYRTQSATPGLAHPQPPPLDKKELAENGSLFAYNYITIPEDGLSIVGKVIRQGDKRVRFLKGGSSEIISYRFNSPRAAANSDILPHNQKPYFSFFFPCSPIDPRLALPASVQLDVTAVPSGRNAPLAPMAPQQKTINLNLDSRNQYNYCRATWTPEVPSELFSPPGDRSEREITVTVSCHTPGVYLQILEGTEKSFFDFNVVAFPAPPTGDPARDVIPLTYHQPSPIVSGFQRYNKQQIQGPRDDELYYFGPNVPTEVAVFRFRAADLGRIPVEKGNFKINMVLDVDKDRNQAMDTTAQVEVYNENAPTESATTTVRVNEKRNTEVSFSSSFLGGSDPSKRGDLVVLLSCRTLGHWIAVNNSALRIESPPSPFLLNLVKSELVLFFEATLLVVICVAASVRLGWPVAMLAAAVCYLLGYARGFITSVLDLGGISALGYMDYSGHPSRGYAFFDAIFGAIWNILHFIIYLLPDFTRFDYLCEITQLRNMPWSTLALSGGWMLLYCLPFIAIGYLLFRKQELG
ncbi:MAG: ABC transporter permease [Phycisphaerales bacterium]|nr:ABC transporter permease [Phycisphaerales bacterium]